MTQKAYELWDMEVEIDGFKVNHSGTRTIDTQSELF